MSIFGFGKQCGYVVAGDFNVNKNIFSTGSSLKIYNGFKKDIEISKDTIASYNIKSSNINGFGATRVELIFKDNTKLLIELDKYGTTTLDKVMF